ncbi:MAG TPA: hypothetical protein VF491_17545 [Vicinamibacterales bacterium]
MSAAGMTQTYATVPRVWPGETVVCLGTGPSLTHEDVEYCRGRARVIAVKHAIEWAPWADAIYSCGMDAGKWWQRHGDALAWFDGLRYTLDPSAAKWAQVLRNTGFTGLETSPDGLRTGKNSGYQCIGLAKHLGAAKIVLLGYDMQPSSDGRDHFFGTHWHGARPPFAAFIDLFETLVAPLRELGIQIINASRETALTAFARMSIQEALA